jgi:cobalt-zinc-cadmium efflux system outer membrane protein
MFLHLIRLGALCALTGLSVLVTAVSAASVPPGISAEEHALTLEEALARTLQSSRDLIVATEELRTVEAEALSASRLPNPDLTITLENVAGDGTYQDTDAAELTIELSQPIELGGKRRLRREAAELNRQLASHGTTLANTEVLATTRQRFIALLAAQERLALAKEQAELAETSLAAARDLIEAGKAPEIDRLRLEGEASLARLAVTRDERALVTARLALAASWGDAQPDFDRGSGDLATLPAAPELSAVETAMEQAPAAANRRIATELQRVELGQAKARRIPDPRLTVGWRQFEESNEDAWLFGISFPLPLFNQGQHEVAAASSRFNAAQAREFSSRNQLRSTLRSAWQALADARAEAEVLASQVVPAASEGFTAAEFGYRAGKFGLLELLDAQRALFAARQRQLDAQIASHQAAIELQRLLGREPTPVITPQSSSL